MQVDVIQSYERFKELEANWQAVYEADPEAHFFLSWAWLSRVFTSLDQDWRILAVKPEPADSHYVAFFPLRVSVYLSERHQVFCNELQMPGFALWSDYTGLICMSEWEQQAIPILSAALTRLHWAQLHLKHLRMSDRRLNMFLDSFKNDEFVIEARPRGRNSDGVDNDVCPFVDLPNDFEAYLTEKMNAKYRYRLRRSLRTVEDSQELRVTESEPTTYERDVGILVDFWKRMWAHKKGKKIDQLARKFRGILLTAAQAGDLYLPMLWSGDRPIAALGTYVDWRKKVMYVKATGRDQSWKMPPPGLVVHGHSIRWGINHGMKRYDFMRGDEDYKYYYGSSDQRLTNLRIRTRSRKNLHGRLDPLSVEDVLQRANEFQEEGQMKKAAAGYRQVLEICPDHPATMWVLGDMLLRNQHFTEARQVAMRFVHVQPAEVAAWRLLGNIQLGLEAFKEAESAFRMAIELNPTITDHFCLGCALQRQGRRAEAVKELKVVLSFASDDSKAARVQAKARQVLARFAKS